MNCSTQDTSTTQPLFQKFTEIANNRGQEDYKTQNIREYAVKWYLLDVTRKLYL